ncbi:MAG: hypothetical protein KF861_23260, partial [Planctomycetaceae bacterium]|nr:hypothetical protein [Planctomycetaceae bacterium]
AHELVTAGSELTAELFRGAKVKVRGADLSNVMHSVSQARTITSVMSELGDARSAFEKLILPHFGASLNQVAQDPTWAKELMKVLPGLTTQIHELVKLLPGIGVVASTVSALSKLYDVHKTDNHRSQLLHVSASIPKGDARTSLTVIKTWQDRYIQDQKLAAVLDATSAGVQLATILVPAGQPAATIFGAAKSVAQMMNVVIDLGVQYRESQALEGYLRSVRTIDADIFAVSPLVGAYYVLNVPFSVFSLHLVPFDSPTFFADTEWLRESGGMKAILSDAERLLDASKYVLISANGLPYRSREDMRLVDRVRLKASQVRRDWSA